MLFPNKTQKKGAGDLPCIGVLLNIMLSLYNATILSAHTFINICEVPSYSNRQKTDLQDKAGEHNQQKANLTY